MSSTEEMERISKLSNNELLDYLKFRRKIIMFDEYVSYAILLFVVWNVDKYGFGLIILIIVSYFIGVYLKGYKNYWKLSNKYLVKE